MPALALTALITFGTLAGGAWIVHAIRAPAIAEANALAAVAQHNAAQAAEAQRGYQRARAAEKAAREALRASEGQVRVEIRRIPVYPETDPCGECALRWSSSPDAAGPREPSSE